MDAPRSRPLAGRNPPFPDGDIAYRHIHEEPASLVSHDDSIPAAVDALVLELLAKTMEERPPDALSVVERFRRIEESLP